MSSRNQIVGYPVWLTAGIGVVVFFAFCAAFQSYRASDTYARAYRDPYLINAQPERLRAAMSNLPGTLVIGYLSDLDFGAVSGQSAYFGVMYAMAPRLVTRSAESEEWVIGNFSHPLDFAAAGAAHHLQVVKDFGNGVVIFHRRTQ
jgi:hypothetical protein